MAGTSPAMTEEGASINTRNSIRRLMLGFPSCRPHGVEPPPTARTPHRKPASASSRPSPSPSVVLQRVAQEPLHLLAYDPTSQSKQQQTDTEHHHDQLDRKSVV